MHTQSRIKIPNKIIYDTVWRITNAKIKWSLIYLSQCIWLSKIFKPGHLCKHQIIPLSRNSLMVSNFKKFYWNSFALTAIFLLSDSLVVSICFLRQPRLVEYVYFQAIIELSFVNKQVNLAQSHYKLFVRPEILYYCLYVWASVLCTLVHNIVREISIVSLIHLGSLRNAKFLINEWGHQFENWNIT